MFIEMEAPLQWAHCGSWSMMWRVTLVQNERITNSEIHCPYQVPLTVVKMVHCAPANCKKKTKQQTLVKNSISHTCMPKSELTQASDASQIAVRSWPPSRAKIRRPPARDISWRVRKPKPAANTNTHTELLTLNDNKAWQVNCCNFQ